MGKRKPILLLHVDTQDGSCWAEVIRCSWRTAIRPSDFALFERVCTVDAAVQKIHRFYHRYHSLWYVRGQLVIRLTSPLGPGQIRSLAEQFTDILTPGGTIEAVGALDEEHEDDDVDHLPRLVVETSTVRASAGSGT